MNDEERILVALVTISVVVDGERVTISPGETLPPLSPHDERELLDSGCAFDPATASEHEDAAKQAQLSAMRDFNEARKRAVAAQASTAVESNAAAPAAPATATGGKKSGAAAKE